MEGDACVEDEDQAVLMPRNGMQLRRGVKEKERGQDE